jgi:hypothetical protein
MCVCGWMDVYRHMVGVALWGGGICAIGKFDLLLMSLPFCQRAHNRYESSASIHTMAAAPPSTAATNPAAAVIEDDDDEEGMLVM